MQFSLSGSPGTVVFLDKISYCRLGTMEHPLRGLKIRLGSSKTAKTHFGPVNRLISETIDFEGTPPDVRRDRPGQALT